MSKYPVENWKKLGRLVSAQRLAAGYTSTTDHEAGTVTLATGMDQAQRRSTIEHERQHVLRGPVPTWLEAREEREVDKAAARTLLPDIEAVGEALAWAQCLAEAADELWVDEDTLRARLEHLHPAELHYLRRRLAEG